MIRAHPRHRLAWLASALAASLAHAVTLPGIFGDHMVLQQGRPFPIWGAAEAGARVVVTFGGQTQTAVADALGSWRVALEPLAASAEPRELSVQSEPQAAVVIRDVLVGEVWLCSGQSNMFWPLGKVANQRSAWPGVRDGEAEVGAARWPLIRLNCADDYELGPGGWRVCAPESVRGFSAVAYFFGRELHRRLEVPIGLINRSIGGTSLQAWTPKLELEALPFIQRNARLLEESKPKIEAWSRALAEFRSAAKKKSAAGAKRPAELPDDLEMARKLQNHGGLHDRYIAPLVPFAVRGSIWYQGESNAAPAALAAAYEEMLPALIASRRRLWHDAAQPFYFVQLPIFRQPPGEHWHLVREAMRRVHQRTPDTGMVVTYDCSDSTILHPPEKQEVGRRLALWALARTYGRPVVCSGPLFRAAHFEGDTATIEFDWAGGLKASDGRPLRGFELAGADGNFRVATASVVGETIQLRADGVGQVRTARFFFGKVEPPNLTNAAGLPASPFTTAPLR